MIFVPVCNPIYLPPFSAFLRKQLRQTDKHMYYYLIDCFDCQSFNLLNLVGNGQHFSNFGRARLAAIGNKCYNQNNRAFAKSSAAVRCETGRPYWIRELMLSMIGWNCL